MSTSSPNYKRSLERIILIVVAVLGPASIVHAQDVPADLLDLSLEELFSAEIEGSDSEGRSRTTGNRWRFQLRYQRSEFEDYLDGTTKLSIDDVMFHPGQEARTDSNFPVVPSVIYQKVQSFAIGYQASDLLALQLVVPYIKQSTDHFSVVPGYDRFIIDSDGIGDIAVVGSYRLTDYISEKWQVNFGLSLPTGSIDEEGDTPREPGNQQLPYSMQLGSGTLDLPIGVSFNEAGNELSWGLDLTARIRLGENDRDYSLGNRFTAESWLQLNTISWIKPSLKVSYEYADEIDGMDTSLLVPLAFPYPAPVTNPTMYGGKQANLIMGLGIPLGSNRQLDFEFGKPFYQSLNGPQVSEDVRWGVSLNFSF